MTRLAPRAGLLALAAALVLAAAPARAEPPLWKVKPEGGASVDLFGSIHLLTSGLHWRGPAFDAELARADQVWFEIPLGPGTQAQAAQLMRDKGLLPAGETLSGLLPAPLWERVRALAAGEGLPEPALQRLRPWLAELELTLLFYGKRGYRDDLGVESQVDAAAPKGSGRGAFETLAEQVDLLAGDPLPVQVASLKETLDDIASDPATFDRAAAAWERGDVAALTREVVDRTRAEDEGLYRRLFVDRNRRFAARIEALARGGHGRIFVVVGAGHLLGPDGVPALLRRDGLAVEGP